MGPSLHFRHKYLIAFKIQAVVTTFDTRKRSSPLVSCPGSPVLSTQSELNIGPEITSNGRNHCQLHNIWPHFWYHFRLKFRPNNEKSAAQATRRVLLNLHCSLGSGRFGRGSVRRCHRGRSLSSLQPHAMLRPHLGLTSSSRLLWCELTGQPKRISKQILDPRAE